MSGFIALLRKDLRLAFARPATYAFVCLFALSAMALTFYPGRFFDANRADLSILFSTLPWFFAIFTPALVMDTLSYERRAKTAELLYALPLRSAQIIVSKWLSLWLICLFALGLTTSLWISISWLGSPDHGAILAGYLGAALMAASACAISLLVTARTNSQILAFLSALVANIALTIGALPAVNGLLPDLARMLADFSVPVHQTHFIRGVISLSDVVFFLSLTLFGLYGASVLWKPVRGTTYRLGLALLALLALNTLATTKPARAIRADLTAEHLYTLSPAAKRIIGAQEKPIQWTFYYSRKLAAQYPDIRTYGARVEETLQSLASASKGKIHLRMIDPHSDTPEEDQALEAGLEAIPTDRGEPLYFGLVNEERAVIKRFDPQRENTLEYDLVRALSAQKMVKPRLSLLDGIDLAGRDWFVTGRKESLLYRLLTEHYDVTVLDQNFTLDDLEGSIAILVHPPALNRDQDQALSDFIAKNGRAIIFLDPYSEASARPALNGLPKKNALMASAAPGFLLDKNFGWTSNQVVLDRDNAMPIERRQNGQTRTLRQPAWIGLGTANLSAENPLTAHLGRGLVLASACALTRTQNAGWAPLITTSTNSARIEAQDFAADPDPQALMRDPASLGKREWLAAVKDGIIVICDADMLDDDFYVQDDPVFGSRAQADNADFLLNALDWLNADTALLALRARNTLPRGLNRIDGMRAAAQAQLRKAEAEWQSTATPEARLALRSVRQTFRRQIGRIEMVLQAINIWLVPLSFFLIGGLYTLWRRRQF
ncbi:MAG: hypothetical protein COA85_01525 [Robiginitomaculum sp.]|nr:MAG: hypothetical protein COA85_01525 [Robiginitomaculum sp.]